MEPKPLSSLQSKESRGELPTAVFVTAIPAETKAVLAHLSDRFTTQSERGTIYEVGIFPNDGSPWLVIVVEAGPGNLQAGSHVIYANQDFRDLDTMIFAGVAGSLKDEVQIGHVVVSAHAYSYHSGKSADEFEARPRIALPAYELEQLARKVVRDEKWNDRIIVPDEIAAGAEYPCALPAKAFLGPIASGEQVVTSHDGVAYKQIKSTYPDAHVVEMEGYGTLWAASIERTPSIVVRGVSDPAQGKTPSADALNQPVAAAHAAAFSFELLSIRSHVAKRSPPRVGPPPSGGEPSPDAEAGRDTSAENRAMNGLTERFHEASSALLKWEATLPDQEWLERPELEALINSIKGSDFSATVLLGEPGSGKSALLSVLAARLLDNDYAVLAIKADILPPDLGGQDALGAFLDLPSNPWTCIHYLSERRPVVLIVDQLDALASVIDLRTDRLNILLNLIRRLGAKPNIHIVASSRRFEFDHDVRFRSLDAETLTLELPSWSQIDPVLSKRGVSSENWSENFRDLLRSPQSLRIFLELLEGTQEAEIFETYQAMLDKLWEIRVLDSRGSANRALLLNEMAHKMAAEESLWHPLALYESNLEEIKQLEAAGILTRSGKDRLIGFSHQTLFEHTLARAFSRGDNKFSEYVLKRKDMLSVRPKVWATLTYLRATARKSYEREFEKIWSDENLRKHLRYLLAEFMSLQPDPTDNEERWLTPYVQRKEFFGRVFRTMAGSKGWFKRLGKKVIPQTMQAEPEVGFNLVPLLRSSFNFAREETLALIDKYWIHRSDYDNLTWSILETSDYFDDDYIRRLKTILRRTRIYDVFIVDLAKKICAKKPNLAPKIILPAFELAYDDAEKESRNIIERTKTYKKEKIAEIDFVSDYIGDPQDPYRKVLENETDWYELREFAEQTSYAFLEVLWAWYLKIFERVAGEDAGYRTEYRGDVTLATNLVSVRAHSKDRSDPPLISALLSAVENFATQDPEGYLKWISHWDGVDLMVVQRLLARGLAQIAEHKPRAILDFLLADWRRFALGGMEDRHSETKLLIERVVPYLENGDLNHLIDAVQEYRPRDETELDVDVGDRKRRRSFNRARRLRLLRAFPKDRLPKKVRKSVTEEERALYSPPDWDTRISEATIVGSPMGHEAMILAKDKEILNILNEIEDASEWDHPRDWRKGGSIQLSREFGEFAKKEPDRAVSIIKELKPKRQERPAGHAIDSLTETDFPTDRLFDLIFELSDRGFSSEDFRYHAANAIGKVIKNEGVIRRDALALLESWLVDVSDDSAEERTDTDTDDERLDSILWGHRRFSILPHGNYQVLETLALACISQKPMAVPHWLGILTRHLERNESPNVWIALSQFLKFLANGNRVKGRAFLKRLFRKYPEVLQSVEGIILLAHIHTWFGERNLWSALTVLRGAKSDLGKQSYGEILCLHVAMYPEAKWSSKQLSRLLERASHPNRRDRLAVLGIAFCAANLWNSADYREFATKILVHIIPVADESQSRAVLDVFRVAEQLRPDGPTGELIRVICENRHILKEVDNTFLIERLPDILPEYAELIFQVCMGIIDEHSNDLRNLATGISASSSELVDIALTLHRMGGEYSEMGLTLFERLLEINAYGTQDTLDSLDNRLTKTTEFRRPRRRRRRRKEKIS